MKQHPKTFSMLCILLLVCLIYNSCSSDVEHDTLGVQDNKVEHEQGHDQDQVNEEDKDIFQVETTNGQEEISESIDEISHDFLKKFYEFTELSLVQVFREKTSENQIYAPFNFYLALSMLSEMTEEKARAEIEEVLGLSGAEFIRSELMAAIRTIEKSRTNLGRLNINSSLWLNEELNYQETMLDILHNQYGTDIYMGDLNEGEFQNRMSLWVSENTNNEFQPSYHNQLNNTDPYAFISLNALDFYNEWVFPFKEEDTKTETFILRDKSVITCDFMNIERPFHSFMVGEDYVSTACILKDNESILFILPEEDVLLEEFLNQRGKLSGIISKWTSNQFSMGKVKLSVPKFAYDGDIDLMTTAEAMGIKKIFDKDAKAFSDFGDEGIYITDIKQSSKIAIDEKGCSASSYTEITAMGSGVSEDEIEINLNRPFVYVLYKEKVPFLIGLVEDPLG